MGAAMKMETMHARTLPRMDEDGRVKMDEDENVSYC